MKPKLFHSAPTPAKHNHVTQNGFTLVEISIVMIIIGLLIGGVFSGMKLVDNANIQKTVQDIKAIESATLTFRDTYRALPGDIRNPGARIPNCVAPPCSLAGNGNRIIGPTDGREGSITNTSENFSFWSHLFLSDIYSFDMNGTNSMEFGEGQPNGASSWGYRITDLDLFGPVASICVRQYRTTLIVSAVHSASAVSQHAMTCTMIESIDRKIDDGQPIQGNMFGWNCQAGAFDCNAQAYATANIGTLFYNLKGF